MSEPENFLARWSRRKREAAEEADRRGARAGTRSARIPSAIRRNADGGRRAAASAGAGQRSRRSRHSISRKLPSLDSITAETDIRAFLAPGVPAELTRAALRRAWVADPAIRDFVGLADYDWDFQYAGCDRGLRPLEMTDELRQVMRMISGTASRSRKPSAPSVPVVTALPSEPAVPPGQPATAVEEMNTAPAPVETTAVDGRADAGLDTPSGTGSR